MKSLILSFCVLIIGYFSYGKIVEKILAPDERETPAFRLDDGVDFVPLKTWKAYLPSGREEKYSTVRCC